MNLIHRSSPRRRAMMFPSAVLAAAACALAATALPDGASMNYVINAEPGAGPQADVTAAIVEAGGVVLSEYPEIGVTTAQSADAAFIEKLTAAPVVQSAGPTRTAPVDTIAGGSGGGRGDGGGGTTAIPEGDQSGVRTETVADPAEAPQWDMVSIHADVAHELSGGSPDVIVGVLDSGVDPTHPDLETQIDHERSVGCTVNGIPDQDISAWAPTNSSHGTHVAGTIAAARNGVGIVGVAPDTTIASVKVVDDSGRIYPEYAICGIVWAAQHDFDVTNNSYYVDPWAFWCDDQDEQAAALEAVRRAFTWATDQGVLSVAAAGNESIDLANKTTESTSPNDGEPIVDRPLHEGCWDIPTEIPGVVTVGSLEQTRDPNTKDPTGVVRSGFSNYGEGKIDVVAPGSNILSTMPGGQYAAQSGTSMASPHVAGVAALLKERYPNASAESLRNVIVSRLTDPIPCPETGAPSCTDPDGSPWYGSGEINALDAVAWSQIDRSALVAGGSVQAGRAFSVYGVGFPWGIDVSLSVDGVDTGAVVMPFGKEQFHLDGRLPVDTQPGAHTVTLTNDIGQTATANILVTAPIAAPEVTWPKAGDHADVGRVTVSGRAAALAAVHVVVAEAAPTEDAGGNAAPIVLDVTADSQGRFLADADLIAGRYEVRVSQTLTDGTESGVGGPTGFVVGDGGTGPTPEPTPTPTAAPTPDPGAASGRGGGDASKRGGGLASTGIGGAPSAIAGVLLLLAGGLVSAIVGQRRLARRDRRPDLD